MSLLTERGSFLLKHGTICRATFNLGAHPFPFQYRNHQCTCSRANDKNLEHFRSNAQKSWVLLWKSSLYPINKHVRLFIFFDSRVPCIFPSTNTRAHEVRDVIPIPWKYKSLQNFRSNAQKSWVLLWKSSLYPINKHVIFPSTNTRAHEVKDVIPIPWKYKSLQNLSSNRNGKQST
jgi:hypothetical protein